jgi:hypothetical protein
VTKKLKLMFDECVGKPVMDSLPGLLGFSKHEFELAHVLDKQQQGIWDENWIPSLAADGWIVVTGDRGKRGGRKKGEKLPIVCQQHGVTHIMIGPSLHDQPSFAKAQAIISLWDQIALLPDAPPGSAYLLSVTKAGRAQLSLRPPRKKKPRGNAP